MRLSFTDPHTLELTTYQLKKGQIIGRKNADVIIPDSKVSSKHAKVLLENEKLYLVDLGSTNKILVNGEKHEKVMLENGLKLQIGSVQVSIHKEALVEAPKEATPTNTHEESSAAQKRQEADVTSGTAQSNQGMDVEKACIFC